LLLPRLPPIPTLFPYTTLFRSHRPRLDIVAPPEIGDEHAQVLAQSEAPARVGELLVVRPGRHAGVPVDGVAAVRGQGPKLAVGRSEEHTSELQSRFDLVCRLLL